MKLLNYLLIITIISIIIIIIYNYIKNKKTKVNNNIPSLHFTLRDFIYTFVKNLKYTEEKTICPKIIKKIIEFVLNKNVNEIYLIKPKKNKIFDLSMYHNSIIIILRKYKWKFTDGGYFYNNKTNKCHIIENNDILDLSENEIHNISPIKANRPYLLIIK